MLFIFRLFKFSPLNMPNIAVNYIHLLHAKKR